MRALLDLAWFVAGCGYGLAVSVLAVVWFEVSPRLVLAVGVGLASATIVVSLFLWTRLKRSHGL